MNKKQYINEQEVLRLLDDCRNKDIDKIKLSIANSREHEMAKCNKCYDLLLEKHRIVTEAIFKNHLGRADIMDVTDGIIYEIVCSEKEESLVKKKAKYPLPFEIIRV